MNKLGLKVMAVMIVLGLAVSTPLALAESENSDEQGGSGYKRGGHEKLFQELNLTAEQKERLKAAREAKKETRKASREQSKAKMEALHEAISKPGTTRADVDGLVAEINAMKAQRFSGKIDGVFEMKKVLTPEQFEKMQELRKQRWEKHGKWKKQHEEKEQGQ